MKSILDKDFKYTPAVATNIMDRFIANGLQPRKQPLTEIERLRRLRRQLEALAKFGNGGMVAYDSEMFEQMLAECDGVSNDH